MSERPERCWSVIGVSGDRSCPELTAHLHCRNCPVFSSAGRQLMGSPAPAGYLEEWTEFLGEARVRATARTRAALVFRLGEEWLALDAQTVAEIADVRPARRIAHRSGGTLVGLVNIRGQLLLQVSLHRLLHIGEPTVVDPLAHPRLVMIRQAQTAWVFRADDVLGVQRFSGDDLGPVPVTVAHSVARASRGLLTLGPRRVGYLDADAIFTSLRTAVG